jgi:twitching motility protein PilT
MLQQQNRLIKTKELSRIHEILRAGVQKDASDIHIKVGVSPMYRIHREIFVDNTIPPFTREETQQIFNDVTTEEQRQTFARNWELDFAYFLPQLGRFRVNAYYQLGAVSLAFRWVRTKIPTFKQLGLPDICRELSLKQSGLVILTGPTGCGKSTTLAAMIDYINQNTKRSIITIEDPIEYVHEDKKSIISQREVGTDTQSFANGLKHVLRQDPDVILIGEMRDLETVSIALTAAETGHLILATLHTSSAPEAVNRIIDAFPPYQHNQIRAQLADVLQGVLYQALIQTSDGIGIVPAVEVLFATEAVRNLIREGHTYELVNYMHTGKEVGMQTLDQALLQLYRAGKISNIEMYTHLRSYEEAHQYVPAPSSLFKN